MFMHTCFKRGFESSVSSGGVKVAPEMYPDLVARALNRTRLVGTTYGFGENWTKLSTKFRGFQSGFSHLQIVVLAVCALFKFEYVKGELYLPSFRND